MILRHCRGWTTHDNTDAYQQIVSSEVVPGIAAAHNFDGYHSTYLLRRTAGEEVEFVTIMLFDSTKSVRAFAGENYETAYVPAHAREVLAQFDERSAHCEALLTPAETKQRLPGFAGRAGSPL